MSTLGRDAACVGCRWSPTQLMSHSGSTMGQQPLHPVLPFIIAQLGDLSHPTVPQFHRPDLWWDGPWGRRPSVVGRRGCTGVSLARPPCRPASHSGASYFCPASRHLMYARLSPVSYSWYIRPATPGDTVVPPPPHTPPQHILPNPIKTNFAN